ncbi:hypothetical protein Nepgr_019516 [Nepenthes gracilis]|uniref:Protein kinase domain-containing protein n=1 Tax=Nepenthes gracilis TaxID=150966 RepID=A0AAD3STQ2_NEPGR|nr:hypothetical protein Nepgr_019516 [Nepenthes gracilis]
MLPKEVSIGTADILISRKACKVLAYIQQKDFGRFFRFCEPRNLSSGDRLIFAKHSGVFFLSVPRELQKQDLKICCDFVVLVENAIVILMLVEDHLQLQSELCSVSSLMNKTVSPLACVLPASNQLSSLTMAGGEFKVTSANCKSLPDDAASAAEPYDSISCAFVTYGSCAIDLVEGKSPSSSAILLVLVLAHFPTFVARQLFHDFSTYHARYATLVGAIDSTAYDDRILREVATLFRLQHQHVVHYYQAWFETDVARFLKGDTWDSRTIVNSSFSRKGRSSPDMGNDVKAESTHLYIQMEYCPRALRQLFESYNYFDKNFAWHLFHQIVEGLTHINGQGIIQRELTPNNIFVNTWHDIKIGDFGLAKFLKFEQLDQDSAFLLDALGVSMSGTSQIGTYFYTAMEIEQGWPEIYEKDDLYCVGVVFFELGHPLQDSSGEAHCTFRFEAERTASFCSGC